MAEFLKEQLQKLLELKNATLLSEAEYSSMKQEILATYMQNCKSVMELTLSKSISPPSLSPPVLSQASEISEEKSPFQQGLVVTEDVKTAIPRWQTIDPPLLSPICFSTPNKTQEEPHFSTPSFVESKKQMKKPNKVGTKQEGKRQNQLDSKQRAESFKEMLNSLDDCKDISFEASISTSVTGNDPAIGLITEGPKYDQLPTGEAQSNYVMSVGVLDVSQTNIKVSTDEICKDISKEKLVKKQKNKNQSLDMSNEMDYTEFWSLILGDIFLLEFIIQTQKI